MVVVEDPEGRVLAILGGEKPGLRIEIQGSGPATGANRVDDVAVAVVKDTGVGRGQGLEGPEGRLPGPADQAAGAELTSGRAVLLIEIYSRSEK